MTPERAAELMRELLVTPKSELNDFGRRNGLPGSVNPPDLEMAKELLQALWVGLQSSSGPNWERINTAWSAMRAKHGEMRTNDLGPRPPGWIRSNDPARPTLGDLAPAATGQPQLGFAQGGHQTGYPPHQPPPGTGANTGSGGAYAAPPPGYGPAHPGYQPPSGGYGTQGAPIPATQATYPQAPQGHMPTAAHPPPSAQPAPPSAQPPRERFVPEPKKKGPPPPPARRRATGTPERSIANDVELYAAFCAACSAAPAKVFATMVDYGIGSPEMRAELDEMWQEKFDEDGELHQRWEHLYRHFREHQS